MKKIFTLLSVIVCLMASQTSFGQIAQSENFNGCALPAGWVETIVSGDSSWWFVDNSPDPFNVGNIDGTCMVMFDDDWMGSAALPSHVELISPAVDLTTFSNILLEFDYNFQQFGALNDRCEVDVWDGAAWVNVFSQNANDCGVWTCGPPFPHAEIDVSAYINAAFQVRFSYIDDGEWGWWFAMDNYMLVQPPADDLGVTALIQPVEGGCGVSATETVEVEITNFGSAAASGFDVCFDITGPVASSACENVGALSIAPGATATYTFTTTADLSTPGSYIAGAWTDLGSDAIPANDSLLGIPLDFTFGTLPVSDDFNSYADASTIFLDLENVSTTLPWQTNFGGTPSTATGPTGDVDGSGGYIYTETSPLSGADSAILITQCLDLTGISTPVLQFAYHMFGSSINRLNVEVIEGVTETSICLLEGQSQFANTDPWLDTLIDLSPWIGDVIQIRFTGSAQADGTGIFFNGDISLDDIVITDLIASDGGVVSVDAPLVTGCDLGAAEQVTITIENVGAGDITAFDVAYTLNGGAPVVENVGALLIPPGGSALYTFAATEDLSTDGLYDFVAYTLIGGDTNFGNDTATATVENAIALTTFPYAENFDASTLCGDATFACIPDQDCATAVGGGWIQAAGDDLDWSVGNFGTGSGGTGPSGDHTSGSGNYIFMETSGAAFCNGAIAQLISPCFDLGSVTCPQVSFWYHMFGFGQGTLTVEIDAGSGVWDTIWTLSGDQGDAWLNATVDLSAYIGTVSRFRISSLTGIDFTSDMAVDDFSVLDNGTDASVQSIDNPASGCDLGTVDVEVTLFNGSCAAAPAFDVTLEVDGSVIVTDTYPAGLPALGTASHTFTVPVSFITPSTSIITAWTSVAADGNPFNDTASIAVTSSTPPVVNTGFDPNYCIGTATYFPDPIVPGGTWTGTGIIDGATGELDPAVIGAGNSSDITYTFTPTGAYTAGPIPHAPILSTAPTLLALTDDDLELVPIGFAFPFFGEAYSDVEISSNGFLTFNSGVGATGVGSQFIPDAFDPNNLIAVVWTDLNPLDGGFVTYETIGTAPNRQFVVTYENVPHFGSAGTLLVGAQAVLYEGSGIIDLHIVNADNDGGFMTQGIENADGTEAYASDPIYNNSVWTQSAQSWRFVPTPCGNTITETVTIDPATSIDLGSDVTLCADSTGILDAGPGAASYSWSTGDTTQMIEVGTSGIYSVTVGDALGCIATGSVGVIVSAEIEIGGSKVNVECAGDETGSFDLNVSGGTPPYTVLWSTGDLGPVLTDLPAGSYGVAVTDVNGCIASSTENINEPNPIDATFDVTNASFGAADGEATIDVSGGFMPYTYSWSSGGTGATETGLAPGSYTVNVTDDRGCTATFNVTVEERPNGIETLDFISALEVFPNPTDGNFTVTLEMTVAEDVTIEIYDALGRLVTAEAAGTTFGGQWAFDLSEQPAGNYRVSMRISEYEVNRSLMLSR